MTHEDPGTVADEKAILYAKLKSLGIASVQIAYDGSGDSGCIESIQCRGPNNTEVTLPDTSVGIRVIETKRNPETGTYQTAPVTRTVSAREALESWCYDLLEEHFPGWEIDDGASGTITLNVAQRTGQLSHDQRIVETISHVMEV